MTSTRYRLVHFVPDPFQGARVPVAAVLQAEGRVSVHEVPHIPGPECLGGKDRAALVSLMLEGLGQMSSFEQLPAALGPQAVLDTAREVPAGVNAQKWLERRLAATTQSEEKQPKSHRPPQRATFGYQFFSNWGVATWVQKTFEPGVDIQGFLPSAAPIGKVSHYVEGQSEILLMEPLLPSRMHTDEDLHKVACLFGGYKAAIKDAGEERATLIAYVLDGGNVETRQRIGSALRPYADQVIDTSQDVAREQFLGRIRGVGQSKQSVLLP